MTKLCPVCRICVVTRGKDRGLQCSGSCKKFFHTICGKITNEIFEAVIKGIATWKCPACAINKEPQATVEESYESATDDASDEITIQGAKDDDSNDIFVQLNTFDPKNCSDETMGTFLKNLALVIMDIKNSQNFQTLQIQDMIKQNICVKKENIILKKQIADTEKTVNGLQQKVNQLEATLDEKYKEENKYDVVVSGLPSKIDDPVDVVVQIASKLSANILASDIVKINAIDQKARDDDQKSNRKLYVVKLKSVEKKNELLTKKQKYKHLFTTEINITNRDSIGNNEIFIRQHLTKLQTKLYHEAKKIKLSNNFQFLWVKENQILLRKNTTSKIYKVSSFNDIFFIKNGHNII